MTRASLVPLGWDDEWDVALGAVDPRAEPARVLEHHGAGLVLALDGEARTVMFTRRLDPEPTVGDWVAVVDGEIVTVLPRRSLLRRRAVHGGGEQPLAANVDRLLLVCGLDRPVKDGRIQRGTAIAHDAGAEPVVVLTKAAGPDTADPDAAAAEVRAGNPGVAVVVTSVREGVGVEELYELITGRTVALLGESGAGKSSIVNALLGTEVALTGDVRTGDAKGRHTTTTRELHLLSDGGVLIDTPGIREVGLVGEADAVEETFAEVTEVAETCRFSDCGHDTEPGCAIRAALDAGELDAARVARWRALLAETEAARERADPAAARRAGRRFSKMAREVSRDKRR
ncbi:MAG: ribosome small subunit-dependent GTPase A [Acidimicrobiales bacterium]|jgi:ribosome biogenesis GTPase|nr:ribosome small subunit-dependent GTPase A [Acidimicrobiales bacterium]